MDISKIEGQTPEEIADLIKDIIKDKIVCDIGCGGGSFMIALQKYAKDVVGIEEIEDVANIAAEKGLKIYNNNTFFYPLPEADVYYSWSKDSMGVYLKAKVEGTRGIFIFGKTVRPATLSFIKSLNPEERTTKDGDWTVYITKL